MLEGYEWVVPDVSADLAVFRSLDGTQRRRSWVAPQVHFVAADEGGRPLARSDFPWLNRDTPVIRAEAALKLHDLLANAELLPLACPGADLFVMNAAAAQGIIDWSRTSTRAFASGRTMRIESFSFKSNRVPSAHIFRAQELPNGPTFVDDDFIEAVQVAGLKGVAWQFVWSDSTTSS